MIRNEAVCVVKGSLVDQFVDEENGVALDDEVSGCNFAIYLIERAGLNCFRVEKTRNHLTRNKE